MSDEVIDCGNALSIADVGDLYAKLLALLAEGKSVTLNCSEIERIDTAALQLLYSFSKEARNQDIPIIWEAPSDVFMRSAQTLGLAESMIIDDNSN